MSTPASVRLDAELVRRGLARSRRRAAELVAEGRVSVAGAPARKPSQPVDGAEPLLVVPGPDVEYVSRGAHKLIGALIAVERLVPGALQVEGTVCLDAGASTGGFTQVLLERGAVHVLAVDVGHGQMAEPLRLDPRVTVREGTNVRELVPEDLDARPGLLVADLSFISLTLVIGPLVALVEAGGHLLVMVKPQFEVGRERLGSGGVVTSDGLRQESVVAVARAATKAGASVRAVVPSPLPGPSGNQEYFLWLGVSAEHRVTTAASSADSTAGPVSASVPAGLEAAVRTAVVDATAALVEGSA